MSKKRNMKALAIALCATTMAGLYAADAHAKNINVNNINASGQVHAELDLITDANVHANLVQCGEVSTSLVTVGGNSLDSEAVGNLSDLAAQSKDFATKEDVKDAVAGKADKTYVQNKFNAAKTQINKVDQKYEKALENVDGRIGYAQDDIKVNTAAIAGLDTNKAEKAYVDTELSKKADADKVQKISYNDEKQRTEISGNTVTKGNANVWGDATAKNVNADKNLNAGGNAYIKGNLEVGVDATVRGHLSAASANVSQVAAGTVSADKVTGVNVNADKDIYAGGNATVKGHLSAASANVTDLNVRNLGVVGVGDVGEALNSKVSQADFDAAVEAGIDNDNTQNENIVALDGKIKAETAAREALETKVNQKNADYVTELNKVKGDVKDGFDKVNGGLESAFSAIDTNTDKVADMEQAIFEMNENKLDKDDYIKQNLENQAAIEANQKAIADLTANTVDQTAVNKNTKDIFETKIQVGENTKNIENLQDSLDAVAKDRIDKDAEHDQALHEMNENKLDKDAYIDQNLKTQAAIEDNKDAIEKLDENKASKSYVDAVRQESLNADKMQNDSIVNAHDRITQEIKDSAAADALHTENIKANADAIAAETANREAADRIQDMNISNNATNIQVVGSQANANSAAITENIEAIEKLDENKASKSYVDAVRQESLNADKMQNDSIVNAHDRITQEIKDSAAADALHTENIKANADAIATETANREAADKIQDMNISNNATNIQVVGSQANANSAAITENIEAIEKLDENKASKSYVDAVRQESLNADKMQNDSIVNAHDRITQEIKDSAAADALHTENIKANADAIATETANREAADRIQDMNIATNATNIQVVGNQANANASGILANTDLINRESIDRAEADSMLNDRVDKVAAESNRRDDALEDALAAETDNRLAADAELKTDITTNANAIDKLDTDLNKEIDNRLAADAELKTDITTNANAIDKLDTDLNKEIDNRLAADAELKADITTNANAIDKLDTALGVETDNRVAADNALKGLIDINYGHILENAGAIAQNQQDIAVLEDKTTNITYDQENNTTNIAGNLNTDNIIVNKGEESQVVIDENGITVGLNSTVMDENGFYAGGHDMENAKAGMTEDGSLKAANGAFTVDKTGKVDIDKLLSLGEIPDVEQAINDNKNAIAQETVDRVAADKVLQDNIDAEAATRAEADKKLQSNIDAEAATRAEADKKLQSNIDAEAATRAEADKVLQDNIDAEAATRSEADKVLQDNIDAEAATRAEADKVLQDNIDAEAATRAEADKVLQDNIDAEAATRSEADKVLQSNIDKEASTRAEADKVLQSNIDKEASTRAEADKVLQGNIDAEAATRAEADTRLDNRITSLDGKVEKVGAGAAALAALHPMDFDPDDKLSFAAGVGNYGSETASALGMFYRPTEKVMLSASGTLGTGENMVNMGLSFALDKKNNVSNTRVALAQEVVELRAQVAKLTAMVQRMAGNSGSELVYTEMFPDIPENHWAYEYIEGLQQRGILDGYPEGYFKGDKTMTRYEFAAMLFRALEKGFVIDEELMDEFRPELGRIRVERIKGIDTDTSKVERVRVVSDGNRDDYGYEVE